MRFKRRRHSEDAELNITSFMNLMIVLVPVLLLSMVFSHISVLDLNLPDSAASASTDKQKNTLDFLEVVIYPNYLGVNHPAGNRAATICPKANGKQNFALLSQTLQQIKVRLKDKGLQKDDIVILAQPNTRYQTIVTTMDTVRSFKAVVAANSVNAALFPKISLGDAPVNDPLKGQTPCLSAGGSS